jgi:predicted helicase
MLSQHIITKPVFEALFEGYSFVQNNAVSISMQKALDAIEAKALEDIDAELLDGFYKSVRKRAEGIDNSAGKQRIIAELYEKFFKTAFPKMVEQLGIVYTPPEVVDFIIHSVNDVLKKEFGRSLSDENVNILDPFTGTGTFITRLLQSGVINREDLERKYKHEIFANEIVLLAYYIAAVNIENAYHDLLEKDEYESFEGIVLTDTFQLSESDDNTKLFSEALAENSERLQRQQKSPLRVIIGNPPYSAGQRSANDNAQNQSYPKLEKRIATTYGKHTDATNVNSLYNSYIKAFRWASDRLDSEEGVVAFVSNGAWIDGNAQQGMRKVLEQDFTKIYVFDLRGDQRTSGELSRKEGGKIFGSGSRNKITITLLIRNKNNVNSGAEVFYKDIGDYKTREEKLATIAELGSYTNTDVNWEKLSPNEHGDWINKRNDNYDKLINLSGDKSVFNTYTSGSQSARDAWIYNYSTKTLSENIKNSLSVYHEEQKRVNSINSTKKEDLLTSDLTKISWSRKLKRYAVQGKKIQFNGEKIKPSIYRPFTKSFQYFDSDLIEYMFKIPTYFPDNKSSNLVICLTGRGSSKDFSTLIVNINPDYEVISKSLCFPLYVYEKLEQDTPTLFDGNTSGGYVRKDGISDFILQSAQNQYHDKNISKEDIFYYVYGILHGSDYREEFANDLKKLLPRVPLVERQEDFWSFSKAGRQLAELHVNYEKVAPYDGVKVTGTQHNNYQVQKMNFGSGKNKSIINYNASIVVENIPPEAYDYIVNGKSAVEWIIERYQVKTDKASNITNDPNEWAKEVRNPRYILDLLLSVINVSIQTVKIVNDLPKISFETKAEE